MKIALIILHADVARGGAERYTLDLAASLTARGHDVSIVASSFQDQATAGRPVLLKTAGFTRTGRYESFLNALTTHLDQTKYDVVHAMLPVRQCDVYHPHAGVAVEAAISGSGLNRRQNRFASVERNLLNSSHPPVVLCLSKLIADVVHRHYPNLPSSQRVRLFNGTDLTRFDPAARPQARSEIRTQFKIGTDQVVGLMLAQDFERKGLGQSIHALAQIKDSNIILLVGGKQDPERYRKLAHALGVGHRVIFAGPVTTPADFYRAVDFFVLPTRFDPCSLVVLEALAMGLPVISTVQNGACEVMQNGIHGFILSDADDRLALVEAMQALQNSAQRAAISGAALTLRPTLSQDSHLDLLEKCYLYKLS